MHEPLIKYFKNHSVTPLSESDLQTIKEIFVPKKFRKRQFFLQEGEVCNHLVFIVKGAMRQYSINSKGAEHMVRLFIENWWAGDRESFTNQTPSKYFIDAWEDTETLVASKVNVVNRLNSIPAMIEMAKVLDEKHAFALLNRVNASISLTAEQRYDDLQKTYPQFLERFPLHIIASYLGVTPETLSRIRKQIVTKK
ncbi:MAG: Crp/Fnr family transcriptional regulator [Bacteroidota bacterium]